MKTLIHTLIFVLFFAAMASAAESGCIPENTQVDPLYINCDSPYLRAPESCWTSDTQCPAGWDGRANYCWSRSLSRFYRCGTICESIYKGGR